LNLGVAEIGALAIRARCANMIFHPPMIPPRQFIAGYDMTIPTPVKLKGAPGSPYTRKMLAVLRYRHIPYQLLVAQHGPVEGLPNPKVELLPTFYLPNAAGEIEAVVDSTPLIRRFEDAFPNRKVIPTDPVIRFIDFLLEDYGDEWLTKAMFHYRWYYDADINRAGDILPRWRQITGAEAQFVEMKKYICDRQISRLYVVGSNDTTAPVIEQSYKRFLKTMATHLEEHPFLMGSRPGSSDFAAYGQLTQLTHFDPTPMEVALTEAPRVFAWVDVVDDLSGEEPNENDWIPRDAVPDTLKAILAEMGRVYTPVMLANAQALANGAENVETEVDGLPWTQQPFPYQGKCVQWIREQYAALDADGQKTVDGILEGTGCELLVR
jgi:glutathione S-transferase